MEAYRTLRTTLAATRNAGAEVPAVLVTSPSASEGKTTSAINLASSLALAGNRVVMIEADLRRPAIGAALGVTPTHGTGSVLLENVPLRDALVPVPAYGSYLQVLLADHAEGAAWMVDQLFLPAAAGLVAEAKKVADYVIVDSPPLSEVSDALPLAKSVDDVLIVLRLGRTHLSRLDELAEMLDRHEIAPAGFAVVGVAPSTHSGYYYIGPSTRGGRRRERRTERARQPA
jgi:Mrp family chromosome partitioning ATPase